MVIALPWKKWNRPDQARSVEERKKTRQGMPHAGLAALAGKIGPGFSLELG